MTNLDIFVGDLLALYENNGIINRI